MWTVVEGNQLKRMRGDRRSVNAWMLVNPDGETKYGFITRLEALRMAASLQEELEATNLLMATKKD